MEQLNLFPNVKELAKELFETFDMLELQLTLEILNIAYIHEVKTSREIEDAIHAAIKEKPL